MNKKAAASYANSYRQGYLDGFRDAGGQQCPDDFSDLPLEYLNLSPRAHNSLVRAGMACIRDVASADRTRIQHIWGLGAKSADEIARALQSLGIRCTDWDLFLL